MFVGGFWVTHHRFFDRVKQVTPAVLWCNLLVLFTQSLIPFSTASLGENMTSLTVAVYSFMLIINNLAFILLIYMYNKTAALPDRHPKEFYQISYITIAFNVVCMSISLFGFPQWSFWIIFLVGLSWSMVFVYNKNINNTQ